MITDGPKSQVVLAIKNLFVWFGSSIMKEDLHKLAPSTRAGGGKCKYLSEKMWWKDNEESFLVFFLSSNTLCHGPIKSMIKNSHFM